MDNKLSPLGQAALAYVKRGWAVFPLKPKTKLPLTTHGFKDASKDEKQIIIWWTQWPDANIGVATGAISGIVGIDIDDPKILPNLDLPMTLIYETGRGYMYIYKHPGGHVPNRVMINGLKMDERGDKGYITVPPSIHPSGKKYSVYLEHEITDYPKWLLNGFKVSDKKPYSEIVNGLKEGERDWELFRFVSLLVAHKLPYEYILSAALEANKNNKPPLEDKIVKEKVDSAFSTHARKRTGKGPMLSDISYDSVARQVMEKLKILATPKGGNGEGVHLLVYKNGVYSKDNGEIGQLVDSLFGNKTSPDKITGTMNILRYRTSIDYSKMNPQAHDLINVKNGMLDWRNDKLLPHSPDYLSTFQINANHDPEKSDDSCSKEFLYNVLPEDAVSLAGEMIGYFMIPSTEHQMAFLFLGPGANGKGTFLDMLNHFLGMENVTHLSLHDLGENKFATSDMFGKLLNSCADLDYRALDRSDIFKQIVGGDIIQAEKKYASSYSFRPFTRLIFSANQFPATTDRTDAFFRRWVIIPFTRTFQEGNRDRNIMAKITSEAAKSWLLEFGACGLRQLDRNGRFRVCASAEKTKIEYKASVDPVYEFIQDMITVSQGSSVEKNRVYSTYEAWCVRNGYKHPLAHRRLNTRIKEILKSQVSEDRVTHNNTHVWKDIQISL